VGVPEWINPLWTPRDDRIPSVTVSNSYSQRQGLCKSVLSEAVPMYCREKPQTLPKLREMVKLIKEVTWPIDRTISKPTRHQELAKIFVTRKHLQEQKGDRFQKRTIWLLKSEWSPCDSVWCSQIFSSIAHITDYALKTQTWCNHMYGFVGKIRPLERTKKLICFVLRINSKFAKYKIRLWYSFMFFI
jgi:hypothetical protein